MSGIEIRLGPHKTNIYSLGDDWAVAANNEILSDKNSPTMNVDVWSYKDLPACFSDTCVIIERNPNDISYKTSFSMYDQN